MNYFQNKVAIVTGASSGIGLATARLLSQEGSKVVLAARSKDKLHALSREIPNSLAVAADVTDPSSVENLVKRTQEAFGRLDILINNAGVLTYKLMEDTSPHEVRRLMEVNFFGAVSCAAAALAVMKKQKSGTIVNVSSIAGRVGFPNLGYYCASKFALTGFSETLRQEMAPHGIRVVTISPGTVYTHMTKAIVDEGRARGKRMIPILPERVAACILRAIQSGPLEVFIPWPTRVLNVLHFIFPRFAERLVWHFRAGDQRTYLKIAG